MHPVKTRASENYLSGDLYFAASSLFRQVNRLAIKAYKPAGLSPSLAYILMRVLQEQYNFPSFLAGHQWLSRSTVTRLIQKLEKMGLITKTHFENLADISPTDKAWELQPILDKYQDDFYRRCYRLVGIEQYEMMTKILTALTDGLAGHS